LGLGCLRRVAAEGALNWMDELLGPLKKGRPGEPLRKWHKTGVAYGPWLAAIRRWH
jgi:hypothetical protein